VTINQLLKIQIGFIVLSDIHYINVDLLPSSDQFIGSFNY